MHSRLPLVALLAVLLAAAGCQRLSFERTVTVEMGILHPGIIFDAPTYQQKVSVTIAPKSAAVSAYLVKSQDKEAVEKAIMEGKEVPPAMLLGSHISKGDSTETYTFEAVVPAKQEYVLLLKGGRKATEVGVKIVGR